MNPVVLIIGQWVLTIIGFLKTDPTQSAIYLAAGGILGFMAIAVVFEDL